ncbi:ATP-dependent Clp protease proteolytic subunit [Candidatus Saccharibacteria bacterium]|nr:ATP-dependent Clp protease proteolytic subunit [Candidatus Saccharibacteria bacterium]
MSFEVPQDLLKITISAEEYRMLEDLKERKLYLYREIEPLGYEETSNEFASTATYIVKAILDFNREDISIPPADRKPIKLYINSPGGDVAEGLPIIAAIELSKTPVYTINVGQWCSMAFLIGITGHKRFSLPYATFLLHEGSSFAGGAANKVQDRVKFDERVEKEVIKPHVLKHSNMKELEYDALARVEYYLLPPDAKERGFIDEVVSDISTIL